MCYTVCVRCVGSVRCVGHVGHVICVRYVGHVGCVRCVGHVGHVIQYVLYMSDLLDVLDV